MPYILDCFCLHRTITLLSKSFEENFPESGVVKLLDRAEMLKRCLRRGSASAARAGDRPAGRPGSRCARGSPD
jgi:hypothetical protein